ncbi:16S rRNA (cytidine(1402)-2'-O)-methyltransferase [Mastigocoleus sp. MO_188.B34]|uniref:16S rRNA (cytidine(1402)-2'-O)-methyltransferase n=1 Tax=Mastigocoleus sp. MO_188.B34 TaxID=3036635 RepID=UPI00262B7EA2|nr:16S rRNA (cytidine(1402)-2'-O)-methyltransferase [Mastigocoleus sp. MO_188.B34]MDJ0697712.1 16S rRNA (cytidine(1402)-2'-O)-methyltransferase [Mastigocoleus sp. MO_188.B34]
MEITAGTLYVVGTPIGNLADMTFRGVQVLQNVDLIAAEDTRHTGRLLQHFQIKTPQISYHEHNRSSRIPELLQHLNNNKSLALVSDAGIPGISDPGYELISACISKGISIVPLPGACAAITALSGSGLPTDRFIFEGFLPTKRKQRQQILESLQGETRTLIFYESPHRLRETLEDFVAVFGENRHCVVAREITKLYEEFWRGSLKEAISLYQEKQPQGEYTLILEGTSPNQTQLSEAQLKIELRTLIAQGVSRSQASRELAKLTSISRRQLYQLALDIKIAEEK